MASLGKKILSAFVDIQPDKREETPAAADTARSAASRSSAQGTASGSAASNAAAQASSAMHPSSAMQASSDSRPTQTDKRFADHFDKLFREANIPGPDYYEFTAMVTAMATVPDEAARFTAAFAGLQVQGLDKDKLLSTAAEYLRILDADAGMFHTTVDATLQEKVHERRKEMEAKRNRIEQLSKEIGELQNNVLIIESEIRESEEKIDGRNAAYLSESAERKNHIESDIEKIKNYLR